MNTFNLGLKIQNSYFKLPILDGLELLDTKHHTLNFPLQTHNTFNVTLVLEQIFSTKTCNRFLQAPTGSIVIKNPDEVHATICDNKIGSSFFTFYIYPFVLIELNNKKSVFFENKIISDSLLFQQLFNLFQHFSILDTEMKKKFLKVLKTLVIKYSTGTG